MRQRWPLRPLAEVCEINPRNGAGALAADAAVTFVPMSAVDEAQGAIAKAEVRRYGEVARGYTAFQESDVLFAKITPCMQNGKAAVARGLVNGRGFGSTEFHVLRPGGAVLPEWVFAFLRQPAFRAQAEAAFTGSAGQQRVPERFMQKAVIPVPPLPEQRRIVAILDEAEKLRKLRREADGRTADLIPALFHDMFGDPAANPRGWPTAVVGHAAEVQGGLQLSRRRRAYTLTRPYLRVANVRRGSVELSEVKSIGLTTEELAKTRLCAGDVLLVEGNGSPDEIGRAAIWDGSIPDCVHQNHIIRVRCDRGRLMPDVLLALLCTGAGRRYFLAHGKSTSGLFTISTRVVKDCPITLPPLPLQQQFAAAVADIRAMQDQQQSSRRRLDDLFQSLLHRAFRGEL